MIVLKLINDVCVANWQALKMLPYFSKVMQHGTKQLKKCLHHIRGKLQMHKVRVSWM